MSVREELLALKNDEGLIIAEQAVAWAKENPDSELHAQLEWDNRTAGHQFRIWQIRRLIAIHIVSPKGDREVISLSIDRTKELGGYREMNDVLPVPELREVLLNDALRELERVEQKYNRLQELAKVFAEVRKVRDKRKQRKEGPRATA